MEHEKTRRHILQVLPPALAATALVPGPAGAQRSTGANPAAASRLIETVSALKAMPVTDGSEGQLIYAQGYAAAGDGGEGLFQVARSSSGEDNGGTIIRSNTAGYSFVRQFSGALNLRWFGASGRGANSDDTAVIQNWLAAIPSGGAGYIPPAQPGQYYRTARPLTRAGQVTIFGDGLASRLHFDAGGVALILSNARFSRLENWYLTGTRAAAGGVYVKSAQEGFSTDAFFCDGFNGTSAYAMRFSSSWGVNIFGGGARQSTTGLLFDAVNDSVAGVNNNISVFGCNLSACAIGIDYQSGSVANFIGNDFSNDGGFIAPVAAIEIGRGVGGSTFVDTVTIIGNYGENVGNGYRIGRNNTSGIVPKYVTVLNNRADFRGEMLRIFKGDQNTVWENNWGAGTCIIDAGVTRTNWYTVAPVRDNSAPGQTTYIRNSSVESPQIVARARLTVPSFTVTDLPPANPPGQTVYVSNESGGPVLAFSDGRTWRRVTDRAVVS